MSDEQRTEGLKERLSRQGEEALGRLAEELAANSVVSSAIASAFEARERAVAAQEAAMGALGIPSAADIERLTRRIRSVSQRLEGIEDALDRLDDRLAALDGLGERIDAVAGAADGGGSREGVELRLLEIKADVSALREALDPAAVQPVPSAQERLAVTQDDVAGPVRRNRGSSGSGTGGSAGRGSPSRRAGRGSRSAGSTSPGSGSGR